MKILKAKLKEPITAAVTFDVFWDTDPLRTSVDIERHKKSLVSLIREQMHEKIAVLSIDDVEFSIQS